MNIFINDKLYELKQDFSLTNALKLANIFDYTGLAIAVNSKVILKEVWNTFMLNENDKVLIIKATQGG